jgi:hypothetical protein
MYPGGMMIDHEEEQAVLEVLRSRRLFRYYGPERGPLSLTDWTFTCILTGCLSQSGAPGHGWAGRGAGRSGRSRIASKIARAPRSFWVAPFI